MQRNYYYYYHYMNEALAWLILLGCVKVKYLVLVFNSPAGCLKRQDILVGFLANHFVLCHAPLIICVCVCVLQNQLVDVCEKMQLKALRIEKFINQTLTAKDQRLLVKKSVQSTVRATVCSARLVPAIYLKKYWIKPVIRLFPLIIYCIVRRCLIFVFVCSAPSCRKRLYIHS